MNVLVAYASKYGSTEAIARRVADRIRERGLTVDLVAAANAHAIAGYDAFVVGSAVYMGAWLKDATRFVADNRAVLSNRPLWLFSSGPLGEHAGEARSARDSAVNKTVAELKESLRARDHRIFFGALDRDALRFPEKWIAAMPAFPGSEGDFRDWQEIDAWSALIADALTASTAETVPASR